MDFGEFITVSLVHFEEYLILRLHLALQVGTVEDRRHVRPQFLNAAPLIVELDHFPERPLEALYLFFKPARVRALRDGESLELAFFHHYEVIVDLSQ